MKYDAFISYASEDKKEVAQPLAYDLKKNGATVWFDEFMLSFGDNLLESIMKGLDESSHGIIILSLYFFKKKWTNFELNELLKIHKQISSENRYIIPIWHNVNQSHIRKKAPSLENIKAINSDIGILNVSKEILKIIHPERFLNIKTLDDTLRSKIIEKVKKVDIIDDILKKNVELEELLASILKTNDIVSFFRHYYNQGKYPYDPDQKGFRNMINDEDYDSDYYKLREDIQILISLQR